MLCAAYHTYTLLIKETLQFGFFTDAETQDHEDSLPEDDINPQCLVSTVLFYKDTL